MAEVHRFPDLDEVKYQASARIVRLQADDVTKEDRTAFDAWREAHPSHVPQSCQAPICRLLQTVKF